MKRNNKALIFFLVLVFNLVYFLLSVAYFNHVVTYLLFHLSALLVYLDNKRAKISPTYVVSLANHAIGLIYLGIAFVIASLVVTLLPFTGNLAIFLQLVLLALFFLVRVINANTQ